MPATALQREIHVAVSGDEIADIINHMARRCIRGIARASDTDTDTHPNRIIADHQERALDALEDLYTRVDERAEFAKMRNRGNFPLHSNYDDEVDELALSDPTVIDVTQQDSFFGDDERELHCFCQKPAYGRMYGCAGRECVTGWFHEGCIGTLMKKVHWPVEGEVWMCPVCAEEEKRMRRERSTGRVW